MTFWGILETVMIVGPILGLLILGLVIALRSGVISLGTHQGLETLAGNFSQLLVRLAGFGVGLMALERFVGLPSILGW